MPDLRHSPLRVKSAPRAGGGGGRLIILFLMVTHAVASMSKTAKCTCVANKVNYFETVPQHRYVALSHMVVYQTAIKVLQIENISHNYKSPQMKATTKH